MQEEARRGRYIRGFDLIQAIESAGEWVDWQELNRMMQSNVQNGKMLAFLLQLDYYDASQQDDIQDRMVINNLITMTEDRLRPHLYEQLYAVQDKTLMIGLLNYAPRRKHEGAAGIVHRVCRCAAVSVGIPGVCRYAGVR